MSLSSTSGRISILAALVLGFSALVAAPAAADPGNAKNAEVIPLDCDGTTYTVVVNGNGAWTPAHDTASSAMFIPVSFGPFTGIITAEDGTVVEEFTEPAETKGSGKNADIDCSFTITNTFEDPSLGEGTFTFTGTGTVSGFATPRR
jgi:hypothetical protein